MDLWQGAVASFIAVGAVLMGVAGVLFSVSKVPSLWASIPAIIAYAMFALAVACFACSVRNVRFPFAVGPGGGRVSSAPDGHSSPAPEPPRPSLELTVEDARWDQRGQAGYIYALLVKITNTTDRPIAVARYDLAVDWQRGPDDAPVQISAEDGASLREETRARSQGGHYGPMLSAQPEVPPHGQVSGWLVAYAPRTWTGGTLRCTVTAIDSIDHKYVAVAAQ